MIHPLIVAHIDPAHCIGCTFCLKACPVDAIFGAAKKMHTVIETGCTGCEQCVTSCPTSCITMQPATKPRITPEEEASRAQAKQARLAQGPIKKITMTTTPLMDTSTTHLKSSLLAAITRGKAKRESNTCTIKQIENDIG